MLVKLKKVTSDPKVSVESAKNASNVGYHILAWVLAVEEYARANATDKTPNQINQELEAMNLNSDPKQPEEQKTMSQPPKCSEEEPANDKLTEQKEVHVATCIDTLNKNDI